MIETSTLGSLNTLERQNIVILAQTKPNTGPPTPMRRNLRNPDSTTVPHPPSWSLWTRSSSKILKRRTAIPSLSSDSPSMRTERLSAAPKSRKSPTTATGSEVQYYIGFVIRLQQFYWMAMCIDLPVALIIDPNKLASTKFHSYSMNRKILTTAVIKVENNNPGPARSKICNYFHKKIWSRHA